MGTNGIETVAGQWLEDEVFRAPRADRAPASKPENGSEAEGDRPRVVLREADLALAPLVDKIAYGLARGLVLAMKELEQHIASETRKVGDTVGRRLDTLQASFQDLTEVVSEQRSMSLAVQQKCDQLAVATDALREADGRQAAELSALRSETSELSTSVTDRLTGLAAAASALQESDLRQAAELGALRSENKESAAAISERIDLLCKELGVQQEDITAVKSTLCGFTSRIDTVVERLDRQAEALRSMYSTYSQRETELEQLVDGLARLRAYPAPPAASRL